MLYVPLYIEFALFVMFGFASSSLRVDVLMRVILTALCILRDFVVGYFVKILAFAPWIT